MTETTTSKNPPTEKDEPLPCCDRCGAIVTLTGLRATLGEGPRKRELLLCQVHHREHGDALGKQGWRIEPVTPPEPTAGPKIGGTCPAPECGGPQVHRFVKATPESPAVKIIACRDCDSRTCNYPIGGDRKCDSKAMARDDRLCPKGHPLFGEAE